MDLKTITLSINQIAEEKGIPQKKVLETMEQALAAAYKKEYGKRGQRIEAKIEPKTGKTEYWQLKEVVSEEMIYSEEELEKLKEEAEKGKKEPEELVEETKIRFNPERHIMIAEAKKAEPKIKIGEDIKIPLKAEKDFGRIATQTAKQVILQKLREAEREALFSEYQSKEGEIISGIVQRIEENNVYLDIGKALGILPKTEQVPGEFYQSGQRLKLYILKVDQDSKGPRVLLSRAYPKLVSKLFELEVPEISSGQIEIKSIAREPGSRSKVAVFTKEEGLDPVGSCIGQRGSRVGAVITELAGEKIDIIEYSADEATYIKSALSPAKVLEVKILPKNKALALVPQEQLSLAIGRDGQNVRLAAKLTGWKIDVKAPEQEKEGARPEREKKEEKEAKEVVKETPETKKKETKQDKKASPKKARTSKTKTKKEKAEN